MFCCWYSINNCICYVENCICYVIKRKKKTSNKKKSNRIQFASHSLLASFYAIDLTTLQSFVFIETTINYGIWGEQNFFFLCAIPPHLMILQQVFSDHWLVLLLISCRAVSHFILSCNHWILRSDSDWPSGARSIITFLFPRYFHVHLIVLRIA